MEASVGQWTPPRHAHGANHNTSKQELLEGDFLAELSGDVETCDAEVSRIAPPVTPSTAASTPTLPGFGTGRPRTAASEANDCRVGSTRPLSTPASGGSIALPRPGSVSAAPSFGHVTSGAPASARTWQSKAGAGNRPASVAECHSARGPRSDLLRDHLSARNESPKSRFNETVRSTAQGSATRDTSASVMSQSTSLGSQLQKDPALHALAQRLTKSLVAHHSKQRRKLGQQPSWVTFFGEVGSSVPGFITFQELEKAVTRRLKAPVSRYELRVFWGRLDPDGNGLVSLEEFGRLMYRIELSSWPDLFPAELERCVRMLNTAAEKWHRAGGNWFKIFGQIDSDGNGNLSYDELLQCIRGTTPCLRITPKEVSDKHVQGLWKVLDAEGNIEVPVHRFMAFMRKMGANLGLDFHRVTEYSKAKRGLAEEKFELPPSPNRTLDELRSIVAGVEQALQAYFIGRGLLSVMCSSALAAAAGPDAIAACGWIRFFKERDNEKSERVAYQEFCSSILGQLGCWLTSSVDLPQGGRGRTVSEDDVRALWEVVDPNSTTEVSHKELMMGLYRLEMQHWPDADDPMLERIASMLNEAATRRLKCGGNWYKVFNLVDKDSSGNISFDELKEMVRDVWHGLAISPKKISDKEIRACWKALDSSKSGFVTVSEFMVFMRRYGQQHNMHKLTEYSMKKRGLIKDHEDYSSQIANAPILDVHQLCEVATKLTLSIHSWLSRRGGRAAAVSPQLWSQFISLMDADRKGRLSYAEFAAASQKVLRSDKPVSEDELMAFWREVDRDSSGAASPVEFDSAVYRLQVETWPDFDDDRLERIVAILNRAAEKWHRAAGNWYKVFQACDEDGSGLMDFDELVSVVRKSFPGLSIPSPQISEQDLKGLWKALDIDRSGNVEVYEFMIFMRKHGRAFSMHKLTSYSKSRRGMLESEDTLADMPERSEQELSQIALDLDESLTAYYKFRGIHARAAERWQQFLMDFDSKKTGRLTFALLEQVVNACFRNNGSVSSRCTSRQLDSTTDVLSNQNASMLSSMPHDDLYALWFKLAISGKDVGECPTMLHREWQLAIYRQWINTWPNATDQILGTVYEKINAVVTRRMGTQKSWYKVFNLLEVDSSGRIGYDEFFDLIRRQLPGLDLKNDAMSNADLKAFWKAMDEDKTGTINVQQFVVFMRRIEVRQADGTWSPKPIRGTVTQKAAVSRQQSKKSAQETHRHLRPEDEKIFRAVLCTKTPEDIGRAFSAWNLPWKGVVTEWDWYRIVREVLRLREDDIDDVAIYAAWSLMDPEATHEATVHEVLSHFTRL